MHKPLRSETWTGRLPRRIVVAGNTESAWMAAAYLQRQFRPLDCRITVIADGTLRGEFPGETSQPSMNLLLNNLRVDEHDMMRAAKGTYQIAVQFSDWIQQERDFWIPLTSSRQQSRLKSLFEVWHSERSSGRLLRPFHSYSLHWGAALAGKAPYGFSGPSAISKMGSYAFQLDGSAFAGWLRSIALQSGVEEIPGSIVQIFPNGRGGVAQIRLDSGLTVAGDFFVDGTGAESRLLGGFLKDPFAPSADQFPADSTVLFSLPRRRNVPPFVRMTAMDAGWMWQISTADSIDAGYAFSSRQTDACQAQKELFRALQNEALLSPGIPQQYPDTTAPFVLPNRFGHQSRFWKDNVVAVGSSAFQLPSFVSAGRHLTQIGLELFMELFPERTAHAASIGYYNERMIATVQEIQEFAQLHLLLSKRTDTPFWNEVRAVNAPPTLTSRLQLFDSTGHPEPVLPGGLGEAHFLCLFVGSGRLPSHPCLPAVAADPAMIQQQLRELLKSNEAALKDLPLHEELLDWIHTEPPGQLRSA